jgi:predicted metal-binding membrane protein
LCAPSKRADPANPELVPQLAARSLRIQPDAVVWLGAIAAAWGVAWWLEATGIAHVLHHHTIFHSGRRWQGGVELLVAWQVMTAAMMLPGALPAVRALGHVGGQARFLAIYFAAWTLFAALAFAADMGLHALVHGWAAAASHENLIAPVALGLAAAYELSPWKARSLMRCRRPGLSALAYSRSCVASGWALMLLMFSAGVANLWWMAALAAAMLAEKALPRADAARYAVAAALVVCCIALLAPLT